MHNKVKEALDSSSIKYKIHKHSELPKTIRSPQDFADHLGYPIGRIAKTLLVQSQSLKTYALITASMDKKIDFNLVSEHLGCGRIELASRETLKSQTNYPPNGVSPIGNPNIPLLIDKDLVSYESILIGAGQVGVEIEVSTSDLQKTTNGTTLQVG